MKLSRSLILISLPSIFLWVVQGLSAANTVDCVDCTGTRAVQISQTDLGNSIQLASLGTQIDDSIVRLGCNTIQQNRDLDTLDARVGRHTNIETFLNIGSCRNEWTGDNTGEREITPLQLAVYDPNNRIALVRDILQHLENNVSQNDVRAILNQTDDQGRSVMDFIDDLIRYRYQGSDHANTRRKLNELKNDIRSKGGRNVKYVSA